MFICADRVTHVSDGNEHNSAASLLGHRHRQQQQWQRCMAANNETLYVSFQCNSSGVNRANWFSVRTAAMMPATTMMMMTTWYYYFMWLHPRSNWIFFSRAIFLLPFHPTLAWLLLASMEELIHRFGSSEKITITIIATECIRRLTVSSMDT